MATPSLAMIPSGKKEGVLYSAIPNTSVGDFTVERGSNATFVNQQGLIQSTNVIGGEKVLNGNFSEEGSDVIINGGFDSDSGWNKGTGWTISGGKASQDGTNGDLEQTSLVTGLSYKVTLEVSDYVQGTLVVRLGAANAIASINANGTYTFYGVASTTLLRLRAQVGFEGSIDNVSVKEVGQNWGLQSGWSIGDGYAESTALTTRSISQTIGLPIVGKTYKITYSILETNGGNFKVIYGGVSGAIRSDIGTYTETIVATSSAESKVYFDALNVMIGKITNISVVEVTEATNTPRFDYTDGGCPVLLTEPQRTNEMATSEPTSGGTGFTYTPKNWDNGLSNGLTATDTTSTQYWYMANGVANEYTAFSFYVEMEDGSEPMLGDSSEGSADFQLLLKGRSLFNSEVTKVNTIGNVWKILAVSRVEELASEGNIGILKYANQSNKTLHATGFQIEQNVSYSTSYIPTNGSPYTRLGEVVKDAGDASTFNSSEGVLFIEASKLVDGESKQLIAINDGTDNNLVQIQWSNTESRILFFARSGGGSYDSFFEGDILQTDMNKIALSWDSVNLYGWIDGVKVGTLALTNSPIGLIKLTFSNGSGSNNFYGKTSQVQVFKTALTDAELQTLTTI